MKEKQLLAASLPVAEAADLTIRAAGAGVPLSEYLGVQVLAGAYGIRHPAVIDAYATWGAGASHSGPLRDAEGRTETPADDQ